MPRRLRAYLSSFLLGLAPGLTLVSRSGTWIRPQITDLVAHLKG